MRYILMEVTVQNAGTVPLTTQASDLHAPHTYTASAPAQPLCCLPFLAQPPCQPSLPTREAKRALFPCHTDCSPCTAFRGKENHRCAT